MNLLLTLLLLPTSGFAHTPFDCTPLLASNGPSSVTEKVMQTYSELVSYAGDGALLDAELAAMLSAGRSDLTKFFEVPEAIGRGPLRNGLRRVGDFVASELSEEEHALLAVALPQLLTERLAHRATERRKQTRVDRNVRSGRSYAIEPKGTSVKRLAFSRNGKDAFIQATWRWHKVRLLTGKVEIDIPLGTDKVVGENRDGSRIVRYREPNEIHIWDTRTDSEISSFQAGPDRGTVCKQALFSQDGTKLLLHNKSPFKLHSHWDAWDTGTKSYVNVLADGNPISDFKQVGDFFVGVYSSHIPRENNDERHLLTFSLKDLRVKNDEVILRAQAGVPSVVAFSKNLVAFLKDPSHIEVRNWRSGGKPLLLDLPRELKGTDLLHSVAPTLWISPDESFVLHRLSGYTTFQGWELPSGTLRFSNVVTGFSDSVAISNSGRRWALSYRPVTNKNLSIFQIRSAKDGSVVQTLPGWSSARTDGRSNQFFFSDTKDFLVSEAVDGVNYWDLGELK